MSVLVRKGNLPLLSCCQKLGTCGCQHEFRWQAAIGLVGPFMIVEPGAASGIVLHFADRLELVLTQPAVAHRAVVTLHETSFRS